MFKNKNMTLEDIKSILFGVAVGDALGVPVEFKTREYLINNPVNSMLEYGTHSQLAGTWSDDTSMTLCLAEALTEENFELNSVGKNFQKWAHEAYWSARGEVFDIGNTTYEAINNLSNVDNAKYAGLTDVGSNGNGSLMRISPLLIISYNKSNIKRYNLTKKVSSITHGHSTSIISCFYYLEFLRQILFKHRDKYDMYQFIKPRIKHTLKFKLISTGQIKPFDRLLNGDIHKLPESDIRSDGYVLSALEASVWCLLNTESYEEAVLKAVNLGSDTDTTAAITGALAGLLYGYGNIPEKWINKIARKEDINDLAERLFKNQNNL